MASVTLILKLAECKFMKGRLLNNNVNHKIYIDLFNLYSFRINNSMMYYATKNKFTI